MIANKTKKQYAPQIAFLPSGLSKVKPSYSKEINPIFLGGVRHMVETSIGLKDISCHCPSVLNDFLVIECCLISAECP